MHNLTTTKCHKSQVVLWEKGSERVRRQRCKSDEMKEGGERRETRGEERTESGEGWF